MCTDQFTNPHLFVLLHVSVAFDNSNKRICDDDDDDVSN